MHNDETLVAVRMPVELRDALRQRAAENDLNLSQQIRHILRRELIAQSVEPRQ